MVRALRVQSPQGGQAPDLTTRIRQACKRGCDYERNISFARTVKEICSVSPVFFCYSVA